MSTHLKDLDWKPSSVAASERRALLREPARAITAVSGVLIVVGSLLPWASGVDQTGTDVSFRATQGQGDGVWLFVFGLALLILALSRAAAESRTRTLQLAPLIVVACAGIVWITGDRTSHEVLDQWIRDGGTGSQTPLVSLVAVAILMAGAASVWLELRRPAGIRAQTGGLRAELGLSRRSVAETLGTLIGAAVGVALGLAAGVILTHGSVWAIGVLVITGIVGLGLGTWLGLRVARRLVG